MSIKVTSYVWEHSKQKGAVLLLLLAIADFADDDGEAYPGVKRLAKKSRTVPRYVQKLIEKAQAAGELVVEIGKGAHTSHGNTNRYIIVTPGNRAALISRGMLKQANNSSPHENGDGVNPDSPQGVNSDSGLGVNPSSSNPSVEPSLEPSITTSRKKRIAIGNSEKDALIRAWAESLHLAALDIGAELCTAARRKRAAEMLKWPTPVTPEEVRRFVGTRKTDYEFCFLPNDLSKERARAVPYVKVQPAQPVPEEVISVPAQSYEEIKREIAEARAAFLRGAP